MRKFIYSFALFIIMVSAGVTAEEGLCNHSQGKTKDNIFGIVRVKLDPVFLNENTAWSFLGEAGPKNYRANGTWGIFCDSHRLKFGGEYLTQKLHYNFSGGKVSRWLHQWALGGKYQFVFDFDWFKAIQFSGYYSHARSHTLHPFFCSLQNFTINRRIAGSSYFNIEGGILLAPWECGTFFLGLGYDHFRYNRREDSKKRLRGVGLSLDFTQRLFRHVILDLKAEFRKAYNFLEGRLSWLKSTSFGDLKTGVFAGHTWGKCRLASSTTVGGEIGFSFGVRGCCITPVEACSDFSNDCCQVCDPQELARWVSEPAVYIPEVLAIVDPSNCQGPTSTGITADLFFGFGQAFVDLSGFFTDPSGQSLTFTAANLPSGVTISPQGILLVNFDGTNPGIYNATIIATSACGSTSQPVLISLGEE